MEQQQQQQQQQEAPVPNLSTHLSQQIDHSMQELGQSLQQNLQAQFQASAHQMQQNLNGQLEANSNSNAMALQAVLDRIAHLEASQSSRLSNNPFVMSGALNSTTHAPPQPSATPSFPDSAPRPSNDTTPDSTDIRATTSRPRHKLDPVTAYDHSDPSLYPTFRLKLKAKLREDAAAIGSEAARVHYGFGRLEGTAATRMEPWMEVMEEEERLNVNEFFKQLDAAFLDPNLVSKALTRLNKMKQGTRSFREFIGDFEKTMLQARQFGLPDMTRIGYLKGALSPALLRELIGVEEKPEYDAYVSQLRRISDQMDEVKELENRRQKFRRVAGTPAPVSQPEPMDWQPTPVNAATAAVGGRERQRARWVDQKEIDRRKNSGLCIRCGEEGHLIRACTMLPAQRPNAVKAASVAPRPSAKSATAPAAIPLAEKCSGEESENE
jgi:hypothetical protein